MDQTYSGVTGKTAGKAICVEGPNPESPGPQQRLIIPHEECVCGMKVARDCPMHSLGTLQDQATAHSASCVRLWSRGGPEHAGMAMRWRILWNFCLKLLSMLMIILV